MITKNKDELSEKYSSLIREYRRLITRPVNELTDPKLTKKLNEIRSSLYETVKELVIKNMNVKEDK